MKVISDNLKSNGLPFIVTPGTYSGSCPMFPPTNQLEITTSSLPNGMAGKSYSTTLKASGGSSNLTWSITGSTLPAGLSLNASTGVISGTPSSATSLPVSLSVEVTDNSSSQTAQATLDLLIDPQTLTPATIYTFSAVYDGLGNVTSYSDSTYNSGAIMGSWNFTYDPLNRLSTATPGTNVPGAYSGQYFCWAYDSFGNRTAQSLQSTACPSQESSVTATAAYNARNQVTWTTVNSAVNGFAYDGAGEVTGDNLNTYVYDAEGRICAVQSTPLPGYTSMTGYLYDAEGRRIAKGTITSLSCDPSVNGFQLTQSYVLDQNGQELSTLDGNNNWQRTNLYGAGRLLATYDMVSNPQYTSGGSQPQQIPALHFHVTDPLGTRRMQTDSNGVPETDCESLPFGDQLDCYPDPMAAYSADDSTPLHFTGKERDQESGNDYFGARYFENSMGRFLSPDWASNPSAVPYASLTDPQSLNLYSYMRNNPLGGVDPDGHCNQSSSNGHICTVGADWNFLPTDAQANYNQYLGNVQASQEQAQQHASSGLSLPSAMAMAEGPSIGEIFSVVKKWFGRGKDAKEVLDDREWYSYWDTLYKGHLAKVTLDRSGSQYADSLHIGVDLAQLKFDEAQMHYYATKGILTGGGETGGIMIPKIGEAVLSQLQMQIDQARQQLELQTVIYNQATNAVAVPGDN